MCLCTKARQMREERRRAKMSGQQPQPSILQQPQRGVQTNVSTASMGPRTQPQQIGQQTGPTFAPPTTSVNHVPPINHVLHSIGL